MNRVDRYIASCHSWEVFWQRTRQLSKAEMGRVFERLVQLYLQTAPEYRTILRHVWLLRDVPAQVRKRLGLPHPDEGIDLIALDRHGAYWAIQAKFRSQPDQPLTRRELGTFTSLAFNTCRHIAQAVVAHTCSRPVSKRHLMRNTGEIGLDRWRSADWALIVRGLKGESARPQARHPLPLHTNGPAVIVVLEKVRGQYLPAGATPIYCDCDFPTTRSAKISTRTT